MRYLFLLLFLTSCGITKSKLNEEKSTLTTEKETKVVTREPSSVISETKYNVKYKDTTIVTTNYETKTILREVYDAKGNRTAECICDGIREEITTLKSVLENDIRNRKDTEHNFDITPLIYALAVFCFVIVLLGIVLILIFNKTQNSIQAIIKNLPSISK